MSSALQHILACLVSTYISKENSNCCTRTKQRKGRLRDNSREPVRFTLSKNKRNISRDHDDNDEAANEAAAKEVSHTSISSSSSTSYLM